MKVAVIGAGMAGAACAMRLQQQGMSVQLFDKGRSIGGRMTSKKHSDGYVDMGAQYFTARHPDFIHQVSAWRHEGVVEPWSGAMYRYQHGVLERSSDQQLRFIGVPAMQSPLKAWLAAVNVQLSCHINTIHFQHGWQLQSLGGEAFGPFDYLVLALPASQSMALLDDISPLATQIAADVLQPSWAVNIVLSEPTGHKAGGVFIKDKSLPISWVSRQSSKPGRLASESWLLHFTPEFSRQHLDMASQDLTTMAITLLSQVLSTPITPLSVICHRWLYAQQNPDTAISGILDDPARALIVCGDWTLGGRVENAFLSGREAANRIIHYA